MLSGLTTPAARWAVAADSPEVPTTATLETTATPVTSNDVPICPQSQSGIEPVVLFYSMESQGHMNACSGLASLLKAKGARCVFLTTHLYEGRFKAQGFDEIVWGDRETTLARGKPDVAALKVMAPFLRKPPLEQLPMWGMTVPMWVQMTEEVDPAMESAISSLHPNLVVVDSFLPPPCIVKRGGVLKVVSDEFAVIPQLIPVLVPAQGERPLPWILLMSANPLSLYLSYDLPPAGSGLSLQEKGKFEAFRKTWLSLRDQLAQPVRQMYAKFGIFDDTPNLASLTFRLSPFLNVYHYPNALDYCDTVPRPPHICQFDSLIRASGDECDTFVLPLDFRTSTESCKLILFTMGSFGSSDVEMMLRLLNIFAKSPHRFIVSKGPLGDSYELPGTNMFGMNYLPQLAVYDLVDLAITHAGNNSTVELMSFGVKCLALPLFGDQHDNATRIQEKGVGKALSPYHSTSEEILNAVESLLADDEMQERVSAVKRNMEERSKALQGLQRVWDVMIDS